MLTFNVNGVDLAYERVGKGSKVLVLVHGYPLDHTIWQEMIPFLKSNFELILPDLRGFGSSGLPNGPLSIATMAADLVALLNHLELDQAAIAGHSMGGYVALAFAQKWPERLSGLGLISSQALADNPDRKQGRYEAAELIQQTGVQPVANDMPQKLSPKARVQTLVREVIGRQRPVGLAAALQAMAERDDTSKLLPGLQFPLVLLHGDADELIPIERAREIKQVVPEAHLVELAGVGHMPMLEAPHETAQALDFLQ